MKTHFHGSHAVIPVRAILASKSAFISGALFFYVNLRLVSAAFPASLRRKSASSSNLRIHSASIREPHATRLSIAPSSSLTISTKWAEQHQDISVLLGLHCRLLCANYHIYSF